MGHAFRKPCLDCGTLARGTRCEGCQARETARLAKQSDTEERKEKKRTYYNTAYKRRAKFVRDTATICHICGGGPRPEDPFQADHVYPGVGDSPLLPAHRSCNASRGNKPLLGRGNPGGTG